jgi:hypothetical protein
MNTLFNYISTLWNELLNIFVKEKAHYKRVRIIDSFQLLGDLSPTEIVLVGTKAHPKWAVLMCPCGCENVIKVNLMKSYTPHWTVKFEKNNKLSFSPSLWMTDNTCQSHFFIESGKIIWV